MSTVSEPNEKQSNDDKWLTSGQITLGTTRASPLQPAPSASLAIVRKTTSHRDFRGAVTETYRESWFPEVPPVKQLVQSDSEPMTLRGMHLHKRQWDIWRFTRGEALVRLYGAKYGWSNRNEMILADQGTVIAIPPGVAHGFYTETGCTLVYALTEEYTGDDEFGFYPFDGMAGGEVRHYAPYWPGQHDGLHISERDLRAPRLADFRP